LFANRWIAPIAIAYLLGSIPFGYLLVRLFLKQDIRATGSGNIGATNVARSGAKGLGLATLLLDLGKAYAAVMIARLLAEHALGASGLTAAGAAAVYDVEVAAAVAAICGHVFPVWLGFKGGKGVASALGVFLALDWRTALATLLVFVAVFALTRYVSLASVVAAAAFPLFGFHFVTERTPTVWFGFLFIPALIIVKHHANIRRLLNGTESRFGAKSTAGGDASADASSPRKAGA
jgi:glycerol-3-phosphate acyltransferase PlsY